jgi:uncharacterized membrane protein YciS (DUF1049 family)
MIHKGAVTCPSCGAHRTTASRIVMLVIIGVVIAWLLGGFMWTRGCSQMRELDRKSEQLKSNHERLMQMTREYEQKRAREDAGR